LSEEETRRTGDTEPLEGGRFIVEITDWDWHLSVGMPHPTIPKSVLFQGWLSYTRALEVQGRLVAPAAYRWKTVSFWLMELAANPRPSNADLASPAFQQVGHFGETQSPDCRADFTGSAHLPEGALPATVTALGSVWKILNIWVSGDLARGGAIDSYAFSRGIPPKLVKDDWWRE
jgi:hypothetical protein